MVPWDEDCNAFTLTACQSAIRVSRKGHCNLHPTGIRRRTDNNPLYIDHAATISHNQFYLLFGCILLKELHVHVHVAAKISDSNP